MVVAHVLTSLHVGGGERVALDLAAGQRTLGHQVMVVSLSPPPDGPLDRAFRDVGAEVHRVAKGPGVDVTLPFRLAALFRRTGVSVAHLHNRLPLIYGAPAGRMAGAAVVMTRHGPGTNASWQRRLLQGVGRLVHAYVAVSPEIEEHARENGYCAPEKLSLIENGIDLDRFRVTAEQRVRARSALGIPEGAWVMGSVGRIATEKDYPFLVRAAAPLLGPETRLLIVGDGAEMGAVRAEVAAQKVEPFVVLPGASSDVPSHLAAMDLFVLSSRMEGMPLAVIEAMAARLPVVTTRVGGLPNLVEHGRTGYLVPSGDEAALRQQLDQLRRDPEAARRLGATAQEIARARYSRETMVRRYLDLYVRAGARA